MDHDPVRKKLKELLWKRGKTMSQASLTLGRSKSYLHQYLERGSPAMLTYPDSETLAGLLGCDGAELRHAAPPKRKPAKPHRRRPAPVPGAGLAAIPEMAVEAAAGPGAAGEEFAAETARWHLPEGMLRHEGGAAPKNLRILRVRGNSMEPEMREGDRLVVDVSRRVPATGEMFVLWDGNGLVVKRIEAVRGEPPRLRLISANPDYAPYTCLAEDAHITGKVVWAVKRM